MELRQRRAIATDARMEQGLEVEWDPGEPGNAPHNGRRATARGDAGAAVRVGKALKGMASAGKPPGHAP